MAKTLPAPVHVLLPPLLLLLLLLLDVVQEGRGEAQPLVASLSATRTRSRLRASSGRAAGASL